MKKLITLLTIGVGLMAYTLSNPNAPTGYTTAPGLNVTTVKNCTSCHGDYSLNVAGGGIVLTGLPAIYTPGTSYPFTVKISHATANRSVWGFAIKAIDTLTHAVVGTWTTTNANSSIKGTAGGSTYELSHANSVTSVASLSYTYSNLNWVAPASPTASQARVKFYVSAVAGDNNRNEANDYVYSTSFTSNQAVVAVTPSAPIVSVVQPTCLFGGTINITSVATGLQFTIDGVTYTSATSFTGLVGGTYIVKAKDVTTGAISSATTVVINPQPTIPTSVVILGNRTAPACDTLQAYYVTSSPNTTYYWSITGTGNSIKTGQGTSSISAILKTSGVLYVSTSNACGAGPTSSLSISKYLPATPTAITPNTGNITPCIGNVVLYSVTSPTPTATQLISSKYRWTIPKFTTIILASADSSFINLRFDAGYIGGSLAAKGESSCGVQGTAKTIMFTPATPISLITNTGIYNACIGDTVCFAVIPALSVITTAPPSKYRWTRPTGTTIVASNLDSSVITVRFITGYIGGSIKVQASTACGILSAAKSVTITHTGCATGSRSMTEETPVYEPIVDDVLLYPNPNNGTFKINSQAGKADVEIIDVMGRVVVRKAKQTTYGTLSLSENLSNGIYIMKITIDKQISVIKFIVQK